MKMYTIGVSWNKCDPSNPMFDVRGSAKVLDLDWEPMEQSATNR